MSAAAASENEWFGDPHILTVDEVCPPESLLDDGDLGDYDIEHPSSCEQTDQSYGDIACTVWVCDVAHHEEQFGLASSLRYTGTPITEPGTYRIQAWGTKSWTARGYEHDGGVGVMPPEETT